MADNPLLNRELSWLAFNFRVLEEVNNMQNPLLERLKFAAIVSSNLEEFFMVRVAPIMDQYYKGSHKKDASGLTAIDKLGKISVVTHQMVTDLYQCYHQRLLRDLKRQKINILLLANLNNEQQDYLDRYFLQDILPFLEPQFANNGHSLPDISSNNLYIVLLVTSGTRAVRFAAIQIPHNLDRIIEVPGSKDERNFILLEDLIRNKLTSILAGYEILTAAVCRVTRDANIEFDVTHVRYDRNKDKEEPWITIEQILKEQASEKLKRGLVTRLEITQGTDRSLLTVLKSGLRLEDKDIYELSGPIGLDFLNRLYSLKGFDRLRYPPQEPVVPAALSAHKDLFEAVRYHDMLLNHPYHSFDPVAAFILQAAVDPHVTAIKQTLYRVSSNSAIIKGLLQAARNGKKVTVLVELKARFNELHNIALAERLTTAGCHVIYCHNGLKTHGKILLIERSEHQGLRRYVHLSTGNYNEITARSYSDISLFTAKQDFGDDASHLFDVLEGSTVPVNMNRLIFAPQDLRNKILQLIYREISWAKEGRKAEIIIKVNSLTDQKVIKALYAASQAGVNIILLIRGICCLRPGLSSLSANIRVTSIVGRYLEHSRIYYFYNGDSEDVYLSSADLMERNLDRRNELFYPLDDRITRQEAIAILNTYLCDKSNTRKLSPDGSYHIVHRKDKKLTNCHQSLYLMALKTKYKHNLSGVRIKKEII